MFIHLLRTVVILIGVAATGIWAFDTHTALAAPNSQSVEIDAFQLTQGIQTSANDIPLIQDAHGKYRPLVVRVAAHTTNSLPRTVTIAATFTYTVSWSALLQEETFHSPEVELASEPLGLADEKSIAFEVDLNSGASMQATKFLTVGIKILSTDIPPEVLGQSMDTITYSVKRTQTPQIYFYSLQFPQGAFPSTTTISSTTAAGFVKGIFPVAESDDFYRTMPYPTFTCPIVDIKTQGEIGTLHDYKPGTTKIKTPSESCVIFHHLSAIRNSLVNCHYGPDPYTFVYGWVKDNPDQNPLPANGYALQNNRVAFGNTVSIIGQRTFGHELMHNLGWEHAGGKQIGAVGWDVRDLLSAPDAFWETNNITTSLKFSWLSDITDPGKDTYQAWIAADTYTALQSSLVVTGPVTAPADFLCFYDKVSQIALPKTITKNFCVLPRTDGEPGYLAYPFPLTEWPWSLRPIPMQPAELFTVTYTTSSEQILSSWHDARIGADPDNFEQDSEVGFIAATLPYSTAYGTITAFQITDPDGNPVLIYDPVIDDYTPRLVNRFAATPFRVQITAPAIGAAGVVTRTITETEFTLRWIVTNLAPRTLQDIEYQVVYSHNGGRTWMPLAVNLPGNVQVLTINREQLCTTTDRPESVTLQQQEPTVVLLSALAIQGLNPASAALSQRFPDPGILRVLASDGFTTASDEIPISLLGTTSEYCQRGNIREDDLVIIR